MEMFKNPDKQCMGYGCSERLGSGNFLDRSGFCDTQLHTFLTQHYNKEAATAKMAQTGKPPVRAVVSNTSVKPRYIMRDGKLKKRVRRSGQPWQPPPEKPQDPESMALWDRVSCRACPCSTSMSPPRQPSRLCCAVCPLTFCFPFCRSTLATLTHGSLPPTMSMAMGKRGSAVTSSSPYQTSPILGMGVKQCREVQTTAKRAFSLYTCEMLFCSK